MVEIEPTEPGDELIDHVDRDGNVIEVVTRARMRAETLRHRCTYTFVTRPSGAIVVHRRADWKSIYAGYWDLAFGGVCGAGEDWIAAAGRELEEESGLSIDDLDPPGLSGLGAVRYEESDGRILGRAYIGVSGVELTCPDGEVVETADVFPSELDRWLEGRLVCLDTRFGALPLLRAHLNL